MVPYKSGDFVFISLKNAVRILIGIALNLHIALGDVATFNCVDSSNPWHLFFVSYSISFNNVL